MIFSRANQRLFAIFGGLLVFSFLFLHFTPLLAQGLYNPGGWNCTQISSNTWSCSGACNGNKITDCRVGWLNNNPNCACCGDCQLDDALRVWVNIAKIILRFMGVIALVVLIYGGIMWITSGGSPEKIKTGKSAIGGAVAGILVIVFAYVLVYNLMTILGVQSQYLPTAENRQSCYATWPECPAFPWANNCKTTTTSPSVDAMQTRLNGYQCGPITVDGCFGPETMGAVLRFKTVNALPPPPGPYNGIVDQTTYDLIMGVTPGAVPCS